MIKDTRTFSAAGLLSQGVARALQGFDPSGASNPVRTQLPHPFSNLTRAEWARSIDLWRARGAPLLNTLPSRSCPTCGGNSSDYLFDSYDAYPYHECQSCRTWFVPLVITHELFERYFETVPEARRFGDYTDAQAVNTAAMDADRARFDKYYAALNGCLARGPGERSSTLDIGCGVANSLAVATEHGFDAEGIEVNHHAVNLARKLGRAVHFPQEATRAPRFDAVTLWETLEHISDPLAELKQAHARLKQDGVLALTVPNLNAPDIRSMRGDSLQIHGGPAWPGHMNLWTPGTLTQLLRRAGFEPVHLAGQFSTNLEELLAYQLGHWSGARDYLRADTAEFELPSAARELAAALGPALSSWQEGFAFAPILFVLARRSDGPAPPGYPTYAAQVSSARQTALNHTYRLEEEQLTPRHRRGESLDLSEPEWSDTGTRLNGGRILLDAGPAAPFAYLWRSHPLALTAGSIVRLRGMVLQGGLAAGLLEADRWAAQASVTQTGPFEISLTVRADITAQLVISNCNDGCGPAVADIDCAELFAVGEDLP